MLVYKKCSRKSKVIKVNEILFLLIILIGYAIQMNE